MQDIMVGDESFNTSYTGRVIHTLMTPGLITRTYMPQTHCQTSTFLTLLWLDDPQYKESREISKRTLIPTSLWLFNTLQCLLQSTAHFASTIQIHSTPSTTSLIVQQCLALLPPFSSHLVHPLPLTALVTPPTLSHLPLLTARLV